MRKMLLAVGSLVLLGCSGASVVQANGGSGGEVQGVDPLFETLAALDEAAFDAFNRCSDPAQLQKHASYFAPDVEFYHDNGGVTWTREAMLANTAKYVCGKFRRERVPGTFVVHPIKDFGAIAQGSHRFCQFDSDTCDGLADFTMVWRKVGAEWQITRVLSYGHRPNR
ncbi:MAG TPA: nuclear transport factor 2 family protein [Solimonas sp.]